eukprot:scaffold13735_cov283-Alexandrium_tamarense.AAC.3
MKLLFSSLLLATTSTSEAFAPSILTSAAVTTTSTATQLHQSTTSSSPGSVTSNLTPPSKIDSSSIANLFDTRVQKTYGRYPITFVSGDGCALVDEDGREYLGTFTVGLNGLARHLVDGLKERSRLIAVKFCLGVFVGGRDEGYCS